MNDTQIAISLSVISRMNLPFHHLQEPEVEGCHMISELVM